MEQEFRVGAVFSKSLSVLFANFFSFLTIAGVVTFPIIGLEYYQLQLEEAGTDPGFLPLIVMLLRVIINPLVTGALTFGVLQQLRNQGASFGECLSVGFSRLLPVLAVAIVVGLATGVGFLLLVIPGLWIMCRMWVAIPVAVVERAGVRGAMSRSDELTEGSRWPIFGLWLLVVIINIGLGMVIGIGGAATGQSTILFLGVSILSLFSTAWQASVQAVSYYTLRSMKEMMDVDQIAAVFD